MFAALPATQNDWHDAVERFLRANPGWLASRPEIYRALAPPIRFHGDTMADHMAAMVARERRHASVTADRHDALLTAGRAAVAAASRVQGAVIALLQAEDAVECIHSELPRLLVMDAAALCRTVGGSARDAVTDTLQRVLGSEDVAFRDAPADAVCLYREAAGLACHDVLIRIPAIGVLGLASRSPIQAELRFARQHFVFLGSVIAATLAARPGLPLSDSA